MIGFSSRSLPHPVSWERREPEREGEQFLPALSHTSQLAEIIYAGQPRRAHRVGWVSRRHRTAHVASSTRVGETGRDHLDM